MYQPKSIYAQVAWDAIQEYVQEGGVEYMENREAPEELKEARGCFVSIHKHDGSLRGCIGTIKPTRKNLYSEIISNAISAVSRDIRFSPLEESELQNITVSVDVLTQPRLVQDISQLNPQKYGVIISDGTFKKGVLLPGIEGINTVERQLEIAKKKAGLETYNNEDLEIYSFESIRYT